MKSGSTQFSEGTVTVRAPRDLKDETARSSQGKVSRSIGWESGTDTLQSAGTGTVGAIRDSRDDAELSSQVKVSRSIGLEAVLDVLQGTGTVRSAVKSLQDSPKRSEVPFISQLTRKAVDREKQKTPSSISAFDEENSKNLFHKDEGRELKDKRHEICTEDDYQSVDGFGTVVVRSPRANQIHSALNHMSSKPMSRYGSFEEASISGIVVLCAQQDEPATPRSSKSRLGIQEKMPAAPPEDSATNLLEAKAAFQSGLRKGISRPVAKSSRDSSQNSDIQKGLSKSRHSDGDRSAQVSAAVASPTLSSLIIPSLKERIFRTARSCQAVNVDQQMEAERASPSEALLPVEVQLIVFYSSARTGTCSSVCPLRRESVIFF